ncbi:CHRNA7-FAM7A fusion protein isoform X9 [Megachile rotundata]|uniref:CHRNA7-FAM7A fusion protein isoform X9 n=1 Tax=Megachile rotundata TaxID=143995 RepID=UPI003FD628A6
MRSKRRVVLAKEKSSTLLSIAGREEPNTYDELLGDAGLDGPPSQMERFGIRWNSSDSRTIQSRLETGHDSLQQLELERQSEQGDVSNYQANGEFDLVDFSARRNVEYYSCCPEPYPDITYEIRLRRRPMFYVFNLILPCILINCAALLVFYMPSESGEKVTLGISALLSMTVFLMTIRETLPPTEKTPLISLYYGVSICLVSFALGLAVVTLNVHHRGVRGTRVPGIVRSLFLDKLARIVFLNFQEEKRSEPVEPPRRKNNCPLHCKPEVAQSQSSPKFVSRREESNSSSPSLGEFRAPRRTMNWKKPTTGADLGKEGGLEAQWSRVLGRVHATIERNEKRLAEQDRRERMELDWKQVALVSDRALLCVFFLTTIVSTTVILCGSPPTTNIAKEG